MNSTTEECNSFTKLRTQGLEFREAEARGIRRADLPDSERAVKVTDSESLEVSPLSLWLDTKLDVYKVIP